MVEVEIRFKAKPNTEDLLKKIDAKLISQYEEIDKYFKFEKDEKRRFVIRIRKKNGNDILTFKGSSVLKEDSGWQEWENRINNPKVLETLLLSNGFIELVRIKKIRKNYKYNDFVINIDNVEGLGDFVEVEKKGENAEDIKELLINFVINSLRIPKQDIIQKGYVKLMLNE